MDYSSFRAEARKRLTGKWGKLIAVLVVTGLVMGLISWLPSLVKTRKTITYLGYYIGTVSKPNIFTVILQLVASVISAVLSFGLIEAFWKLYNGGDAKATDGLTITFANWKKYIMILVNIAKRTLIPLIMIVASKILGVLIPNTIIQVILSLVELGGSIWFFIEFLHYALVYVIAADNSDLSEVDVVEKSKELMTGKRGNLFVLYLTFIGWILLACLTLGIGMLWVTPYMTFAMFAFYEFCKSGKAPVVEAKVEENPEEKAETAEEAKSEDKPIL